MRSVSTTFLRVCAAGFAALTLFAGARDAQALKISAAIPPGLALNSFRLTPDGQTVVYALEDPDLGDVVRLVAVPVGGGSATTLVDIPLSGSQRSVDTWEITPNGLGIVFLSDKDASQFDDDLFRVPIDGSSAPLKLNTAPAPNDITDFRVSPDSARVVFEELGANKIYSVAIGGGTPVELGTGTGSFLPRYRIAPNSTRVVFLFNDGTSRQLYSIPITGGSATKITNQTTITLPGENGPSAEKHAITPDGTKVLFFAGNATELWVTPIDQMNPVKIAGPITSIYGADFRLTPDGATAVFTAGSGSAFRLYRVPVDGSTSEQPVTPAGRNVVVSEYQMSPNGQAFVYRSFISGKFRLYSIGLTGGNEVEFIPTTPAGIGAYNNYRIDPSGQRVVYGAEQDAAGVIELYSIPIGGGGRVKLSKSPMPATADVNLSSVAISPDGVTVLFIADQDTDGVLELFSSGLLSGGPQKVHPNLAPDKDVLSPPFFTLDSQTIVYAADQETEGTFEIFTTDDPAPGPTANATATPGGGATPTPSGSPVTTATPTPIATRTPAPESGDACADCIDNDFDGDVDRTDADCPPYADGAGVSTAAAKAAVKCQKTLGKQGTDFTAKRVKALGTCLQKAFACVQNGSDAACLAKAGTACGKAEAARSAAVTKVAAAVAKTCVDPAVAASDLFAAGGLGFGAEVTECEDFVGATIADAEGVAACLVARHACRAEALVGMQIPRARELLTRAGRNAAVEAPCLPVGSTGGALAEPKPVLKCQKTIAKAGATYGAARLKAEQKCADAVVACVHLKPGDTACRTKADATCAKLDAKIASAATKLTAALTKGCGGTFAFANLSDNNGLGFTLREGECTALATPADSLAGVASCLTAQHACRVDQLVVGQTPRAHELGALAP